MDSCPDVALLKLIPKHCFEVNVAEMSHRFSRGDGKPPATPRPDRAPSPLTQQRFKIRWPINGGGNTSRDWTMTLQFFSVYGVCVRAL